jgi:hypothetical protein
LQKSARLTSPHGVAGRLPSADAQDPIRNRSKTPVSSVRMLRLIELAEQHNAELHTWLAGGIRRWRDGEDLDRALGLNGRGARRAAEDALLRAGAILDPAGTCSPSMLATRIAGDLQRFKACRWPTVRAYDTPHNLTPIERELWSALKSSEGVRCSARRIFDLLTSRGPFCQSHQRVENFLQDFLRTYRPQNDESEPRL